MTTTQLHTEAIKLSQRAFVIAHNDNKNKAVELYRAAYNLEKQVAMGFVTEYSKEPTRSVIFKSAALLAKKGQLYREAERMACLGLAGEPSREIARELRFILDGVKQFLQKEDFVFA